MKAELEAIAKQALEELKGAQDLKVLDAVRVKYLGKKGELTAILKQMGKLSAEERPVIGQLANRGPRRHRADARAAQRPTLEAEALAIRLAGGDAGRHPAGPAPSRWAKNTRSTMVLDELKEIFVGMGFDDGDRPRGRAGLLQL